MQNHLCSAASFEEKPGTRWLQAGDPSVWLYIPTTLPGRAFPKPVAVYEWASLRQPLLQLAARALLSTQLTEDTRSYPPSHPFLGSKTPPKQALSHPGQLESNS